MRSIRTSILLFIIIIIIIIIIVFRHMSILEKDPECVLVSILCWNKTMSVCWLAYCAAFINPFTSGILYFFRTPVRDYFQWKFRKNF